MTEYDEHAHGSNLTVEELLIQARQSGLTYNQAKAFIAKTSGGHDTKKYSDTDMEAVKHELHDKK